MIVVGCPVYERGWILPTWFDHLEKQGEVKFAFVYTPSKDDTLDVIMDRAEDPHIIEYTDGVHSEERNWQAKGRIETMAVMRNLLLEYVREVGADYYLSLDSDILLPPGAIKDLVNDLKHTSYDAVSPVAWLASLPEITNAFYRDRHTFRRVKVLDALQPADVLCAAILMTREVAEATQYSHFSRGEDFSWSEMASAKFKLAVDTRIKAKHVMEREQLEIPDGRVGF